jgi:hypothetical protein
MQAHSARGGDALNVTLPTLNYGWLASTKGVNYCGTYFSTLTSAKELASATEELALKLCQMSPLALKRTRDLMYQMEDMPFKDVPETAKRQELRLSRSVNRNGLVVNYFPHTTVFMRLLLRYPSSELSRT